MKAVRILFPCSHPTFLYPLVHCILWGMFSEFKTLYVGRERRVLKPDHVGDCSFPLVPSIIISGTRGRRGTQVDPINCIWFILLDTGQGRIAVTMVMLYTLA